MQPSEYLYGEPKFPFYAGGLQQYIFYLSLGILRMDDPAYWGVYNKWLDITYIAQHYKDLHKTRTVVKKTDNDTFEVHLDGNYVGVVRSFGSSTNGFSAVHYNPEIGFGKGGRFHSLQYAILFLVGEDAAKDVSIND